MLKVEIPGWSTLTLEHLVLDLNGTILGREELAVGALQAADLVVRGIEDALDLLLRPPRLAATLRRHGLPL